MISSRPDQKWLNQYLDWHVVRLDNSMNTTMWNWLNAHVGRRGSNWEYTTSSTLHFKQPDHAIKFALTFT